MIKLMNLSKNHLAQKITIVLLLIFAIGTVLSGIVLTIMVNQTAQQQISAKALILMETMKSVRTYTSNNIKPNLQGQLNQKFLLETVPAYSTHQIFENLRNNPQYQDFLYREATLNPINLADKADVFEAKIINYFQKNNQLKEEIGFRDNPKNKGKLFYVARPIIVSKANCLECHSSPKNAPPTMIAKYGDKNGFNWKLNEIVGAQMIVVPAQQVLNNAQKLFISIMGITVIIFFIAIALINIWLRKQVVKPITNIAKVVEVISMGDLDCKLNSKHQDEIGLLSQAIDRLSVSLQIAMCRIQTKIEQQ